jgi:hypothetical protein
MSNPAHLKMDALQTDVAALVQSAWTPLGLSMDEVVALNLAWDVITMVRERTLTEIETQVRNAMLVVPAVPK